MEVIEVGKKNFGPVIDITDPCYNKSCWCRLNDISIIPGEYTCVAYLSNEGEWGIRCMRAGIYLDGNINPIDKKRQEIGTIGVDAGLAGFFENKPDYSNEEWSIFCEKTFAPAFAPEATKDAWIFDEGFFTSSGYGDGFYSVFKVLSADKVIGYEIDFD